MMISIERSRCGGCIIPAIEMGFLFTCSVFPELPPVMEVHVGQPLMNKRKRAPVKFLLPEVGKEIEFYHNHELKLAEVRFGLDRLSHIFGTYCYCVEKSAGTGIDSGTILYIETASDAFITLNALLRRPALCLIVAAASVNSSLKT